MTGLILAIRNRVKKNIPIQRVSQRKALFAYELGKTLALVSVTFFLLTTHINLPVTTKIISFLFFLFITYTGVGSVLLVGGLLIFFLILDSTELVEIAGIYITAFFLGAVFGLIYNDVVNLLRWISNSAGWSPHKTVFIHELDKNMPLQVIKAPNEDEITSKALKNLRPQKKQYAFTLGTDLPQNPFTLLFVANPLIANAQGPPTPDPILKNRELFLRAVEDALLSLESNEIVGHPDIWPYIRVLTLFDENLTAAQFYDNKYALLQSYGDVFILDGNIATHLIYPKKEMEQVIDSYTSELNYAAWNANKFEIDVIFALTASEKYTRSMAYFSEFDSNQADGVPFSFYHKTESTQKFVYTAFSTGRQAFKHEYHASAPGVVALNVLGARNKTYIHEFAHAMSSTHNGAIVDEYYDDIQLDAKEIESDSVKSFTPTFHINRQEKKSAHTNQIQIPQQFAIYDKARYFSDLSHPSEQEKWTGFFPERSARSDSCIMDRTLGRYKFDKLVSRFMYDRLLAKIYRP